MYNFIIADYDTVLTDIYSIFGINEEILPEEVIYSLPNLPAAEMEVGGRLTTPLANLIDNDLLKARLAIVYITAANCLPAIKLAILQEETDSKTTGKRFKDALNMTPDDFLAKAYKLIAEISNSSNTNTALSNRANLLDFSSPATDVITGS